MFCYFQLPLKEKYGKQKVCSAFDIIKFKQQTMFLDNIIQSSESTVIYIHIGDTVTMDRRRYVYLG